MKPENTKRLETKENRILASSSKTGSKNRNPLNKQLLSLDTNYSSSLSFEGEWNNYNNSNKLNPQEPNYLSNFNIKKERDGTIYFKSSGILVVYNGFNEAEIHFTPLNYMGVLGYPDHLLNSTQNIDLRLILAMGYRGLVNLQLYIRT